ncbi:DNA polymerase IV [Tissierella carlieri]
MEIQNLKQKMELNIIHVDMDAFYASVEEQDNPKIKGLPVIVGGLSNHGIVTTANYEARKYGIHSAMPIFMAKKKCPKGCYVFPRMKRYQEVSKEVFSILYEFTDLIEQVSIDEAYLDISNISMEPLELVMKIKEKVMIDTGLTMSVGVSYNKFLAKLASDWNKPDGIKVITEDMVPNILLPLPVRKVHGIGPKSAKKLNGIGVYTIEDLLGLSEYFLIELFGKAGMEIYSRIRGIDYRKVNTTRERKSLGVERTFEEATSDKKVLMKYLERFSEELSYDLKNRGIHGRTITLKIKDENFAVQTRSKTLNEYINDLPQIFDISLELLEEIEIHNKIRLIGITASNLMTSELEQLSLFD